MGRQREVHFGGGYGVSDVSPELHLQRGAAFQKPQRKAGVGGVGGERVGGWGVRASADAQG